MIVRWGTNVKYSHDEEALVVLLGGLREFSGVGVATFSAWLDPLRPYCYSAEYVCDPTGYSFERADYAWRYQRQLESGDAIRVRLWNAQNTARRLVEDHGFACIICGAWNEWERRGTVYDHEVSFRLHQRQTIAAPLLICRECAIDFPAMLSPWMTPRRLKGAINRLTERVAYGRLQVAA